MKMFRPVLLLRWIFSNRIWKISTQNPVVYLTFDDGPTPELTRSILQILDRYEAKATFFCVGENARNHQELIEELRFKGHAVGNHTMSHEKSTSVSKNDYIRSIQVAEEHTSKRLFRPPYGRLNFFWTREISQKYKVVMWSWLSYDFDREVPIERIVEKARKQIRKGDIIVLHDNQKVADRVLILLPEILEILKEKGLRSEAIFF